MTQIATVGTRAPLDGSEYDSRIVSDMSTLANDKETTEVPSLQHCLQESYLVFSAGFFKCFFNRCCYFCASRGRTVAPQGGRVGNLEPKRIYSGLKRPARQIHDANNLS